MLERPPLPAEAPGPTVLLPVHGDRTLHTPDGALPASSCSRRFGERSQRSVTNVPRSERNPPWTVPTL